MHWLENKAYQTKSSVRGSQDYETNWQHFSCLKTSVGGEGYASNHIDMQRKNYMLSNWGIIKQTEC